MKDGDVVFVAIWIGGVAMAGAAVLLFGNGAFLPGAVVGGVVGFLGGIRIFDTMGR